MLVCPRCASSFPAREARWRCDCGNYLMPPAAAFSPDCVRNRPATLWRYRESLGIDHDENVVSLGEGFTPLVNSCLNGWPVLLKLDYLCPTGSYKDRGSAVMVSKLKEWNVREILEDSSGNAGASVAAYAALAGIRSHIYVPAGTAPGKLAQIGMYGAHLVKVPGTREDTAKAALDGAAGTFYASHSWNPYFLAGMKTAAYEIAEQLSWQAPDWVVTPAGGGGLLVGLHLGFQDLVDAGVVPRLPRLAAVQSANCDPIYRAWTAGLPEIAAIEKKETIAEGIAVAQPVRGKAILEAIRASGGIVHTVGDPALWQALELLGRQGVYVEPTAAAAPAAFLSLRENGTFRGQDRVVVMLTGSGLKATDRIVDHFAPTRSAFA